MNASEAQPRDDSRATDQVERMREELAALTEAVIARDTFITVAAHELRNPMTPILGQLELLLNSVRAERCSNEEIAHRLDRLRLTVRRYMKRAVVLLDVSRITTRKFRLEPADCDLAAMLREVAADFADAAAHAQVSLDVTAPASLRGTWDRLAVEQIVDNLVSNAIKYGGRGPVELELRGGDTEVHIRVRDRGKGIPPVDRARIFERFERVIGREECRNGFGVGLWVVGQLVAAMNGSITIEEAPGGGALFIVTLPIEPR